MQITVCDICRTEKGVARRTLPYDRRLSAAGSTETISESFDLCPVCELYCTKEALKKFFESTETGDSEYRFNKFLIAEIRDHSREQEKR